MSQYGRTEMAVEHSAAAELAVALRAGSLPPRVQVPFRLQPGEECFGVFDGPQELWLEGNGEYVHKSVALAGSLPGLVIGGALNMIGNSRRRARAAGEAAEKWRQMDNVRAYVTTSRIGLHGTRDWQDFWYTDLRTLRYDDVGVVVQMSGRPTCRLAVRPADYWFVLLRKLAFGDVYDVSTSAAY